MLELKMTIAPRGDGSPGPCQSTLRMPAGLGLIAQEVMCQCHHSVTLEHGGSITCAVGKQAECLRKPESRLVVRDGDSRGPQAPECAVAMGVGAEVVRQRQCFTAR